MTVAIAHKIRNPIFDWLAVTGKNLMKRAARPFNPKVVYIDYDVICLRSVRGKDVLFQICSEIDMDDFVQNFDLKKYSRIYRPYGIDCLLIAVPAKTYSDSAAANPGRQNNIATEMTLLSDIAIACGISTPELQIMCGVAYRKILASFDARLGADARTAPLPPTKAAAPCAS
jgi:hypothetical protein